MKNVRTLWTCGKFKGLSERNLYICRAKNWRGMPIKNRLFLSLRIL